MKLLVRFPILTGVSSITTKYIVAALVALLVVIIVLTNGLLRSESSDLASLPDIETETTAPSMELDPVLTTNPGGPEPHSIKREDPDLPRLTTSVDEAEAHWRESGRRPPAPRITTSGQPIRQVGAGAITAGSSGPVVIPIQQSGLPPEHGALSPEGPDPYPEGSDIIVSSPDEGVPDVSHLPPEASDPGIQFPAPEAGDPGIAYPAPEDDGPVVEYSAPEDSDQ